MKHFIRIVAILLHITTFWSFTAHSGVNEDDITLKKIKNAYEEKGWFHVDWHNPDEYLLTARQLGLDITDPQTNCHVTARRLIFLLTGIDINKDEMLRPLPKFEGTLEMFFQKESPTHFKNSIANELFLIREGTQLFYFRIIGQYNHYFVVERNDKNLTLYHSWEDGFSLGEWLGFEGPNSRDQILPKDFWIFDKGRPIPNKDLEKFMHFVIGNHSVETIKIYQLRSFK